MRVLRSAALVLVALAMLGAPTTAFCAGWQASSEARAACCARDMNCGMHEAAAAPDVRAQADADRCCAASESGESQVPSSVFGLPGPAAPVRVSLTALLGVPVRNTAGNEPSAVSQLRHVPPHVLFSVFLI